MFGSFGLGVAPDCPRGGPIPGSEEVPRKGREHSTQAFAEHTGAGMDVREVSRDETLQHPRCVFQILKRHFSRYTGDRGPLAFSRGSTPSERVGSYLRWVRCRPATVCADGRPTNTLPLTFDDRLPKLVSSGSTRRSAVSSPP